MNYTAQQRAILEAGERSVSVAVSAGAGCGKTFVLTQRFLAFLQPNGRRSDPLSRIVAITFTERAAREMRHRVRVACHEELLRCETAEAPYWLAILRGIDSARISTIHSWCATLLRSYAVEAGLDPGFGLLDPSFGDVFARRAVRDALCRLLESGDGPATDLVSRFGFERAFSLLRDLTDGLRTTDAHAFDSHTPASLAAAWQASWLDDCLPCLVDEFWNSRAVEDVVELLRAHEPTNSTMRQRRATLLRLLSHPPSADPLSVLEQVREQSQVKGGGGKGAWNDEATYEQIKSALEALRKRIDRLAGCCEAASADPAEAAALALTAHGVARIVADEYARRKQEESRLDFDDLLCLARNLLRDNAVVRRRAAAGIDLLMVDEFQDTDPIQADLVRHLCGAELAKGRLFLVGDAKQSIYRFRRADPHVFKALSSELPEEARLPLTTNFRSQPAILRFVNFTFAPNIPDYEPLQPVDPVQRSPEPCVEFLFAPAEDPHESAEDRRRREARWLARRLAELLGDETPRVRDSETKQLRRVLPGDVAVLFRTLSNVHLYEQELIAHDLPYYLAGGRAFFSQQEIHDVTHLCRWLEDPTDELSLAGVLRSPFFGLTDDSLLSLKPETRSSLFAGLAARPALAGNQAEQARQAFDVLTELRAQKDRLPLAELLTVAVERTGYDASLLCEHLGKRKLANLRKLIGLAGAFDAAGPFTMSDFVSRLREAVLEQSDEELAATHPEVSDVLRLMTIHQSKGLEFPVVVIADMDWRRRGGEARACYHPKLGPLFPLPDEGDGSPAHLGLVIHRLAEAREEEAEQTRLLYVAATRAKDHLILSAGLEQDATSRSPWLQLLAGRYDLSTGLPVFDPYLGSSPGATVGADGIPSILVHLSEPASSGGRHSERRDLAGLRRFRELVEEAVPAPLPPLVGVLAADCRRRSEFTVTELCETDRRREGRSQERLRNMRTRGIPLPQEPPRSQHAAGEESTEYARIVGTVAHAVLERLGVGGRATEEEISRSAERALLSARGEVDRGVHRRIVAKLSALMDSQVSQELHSAKRVHRELEFRLRWDRPALARPAELVGTIDCLFEDRVGNWHLLDYKAVDDEKEDAEVLACHELQLMIYALAVEQFFGKRPSTARLVRLGPPVRTVSVSLSDDALAEASRRIDEAVLALRNDPRGCTGD